MGDGSVETPRPGGERHLGPDMERIATLSDRFTSVPDGWDKATADQVQYAMRGRVLRAYLDDELPGTIECAFNGGWCIA